MNTVTHCTIQKHAAHALGVLDRTYVGAHARQQGDRFLADIRADSAASDLERLVAATALRSSRPPVGEDAACWTQEMALRALAAGVAGAPGVVLAGLAGQILRVTHGDRDGRAIAGPWLQAVRRHGRGEERKLATVAAECRKLPITDASARATCLQAFDMMARDLRGSVADNLVEMRGPVLWQAIRDDDARALDGLLSLRIAERARGGPAASTTQREGS